MLPWRADDRASRVTNGRRLNLANLATCDFLSLMVRLIPEEELGACEGLPRLVRERGAILQY